VASDPRGTSVPVAPGERAIGASVGRAIKDARTAKQLSMRALATAAEISQPFLSQIESGQTMPSLVTLYRVAKALGISPSELLPNTSEPEPIVVSRRDESRWVPIAEVPDSALTRIISSGSSRIATVQEYRVESGQYMGDWYESDGELTVYVVDGEITVEVDGRGTWDLGPGDAIAHPGDLRNRWSVRGGGAATILLVYAVVKPSV
jgi:transcriptional regulator with XRE-family HTH domain